MTKSFVKIFLAIALTATTAQADSVINNENILEVGPGESTTLHGVHYYRQRINIQGTVFVDAYNGIDDEMGTLTLIAPIVEIGPTGVIDGSGRGYRGGQGVRGNGTPGEGPGGGGGGECALNGGAGRGGGGGGGGYGGYGRVGPTSSAAGGVGGVPYGEECSYSVQRGSGGGAGGGYLAGKGGAGGNGGASIKLFTGLLYLDGSILSSGGKGTVPSTSGGIGGSGSGGGIMVLAAEVISNSGYLQAKGETYFADGSGGRIKTNFIANTVVTNDGTVCNDLVFGEYGLHEDLKFLQVHTDLSDFNKNGIPDAFEDFDFNGIPEAFEDFDKDGTPDAFKDSDEDGTPDAFQDFDMNGTPDAFQDFDGDGKPDAFIDFNRNGTPDAFEDFNGNGKPDAFEDADRNGLPDFIVEQKELSYDELTFLLNHYPIILNISGR